MSDTPQVDAFLTEHDCGKYLHDPEACGDDWSHYDIEAFVDLAKKLEHELAEAKSNLNKCVQADPRQLWNVAALQLAKDRDQWKQCATALATALDDKEAAEALEHFNQLKGQE